MNALLKAGIAVFNCPYDAASSVAEMALALLLSSSRRINEADRHMKSAIWNRTEMPGPSLQGRTVAIYGLGRIGLYFGHLCKQLGMTVRVLDPAIDLFTVKLYGFEYCRDLNELLSDANVLSVHAPLNAKTLGILDYEALKNMAPGAYFINTARGEIHHEESILKALEDGTLAGAGIDAWQNEPNFCTALAQHPRVVATPHLGANTDEAMRSVALALMARLDAILGRRDDRRLTLDQPAKTNLCADNHRFEIEVINYSEVGLGWRSKVDLSIYSHVAVETAILTSRVHPSKHPNKDPSVQYLRTGRLTWSEQLPEGATQDKIFQGGIVFDTVNQGENALAVPFKAIKERSAWRLAIVNCLVELPAHQGHLATIIDVSHGGVRLRTTAILEVDALLELVLDGIARTFRIAWRLDRGSLSADLDETPASDRLYGLTQLKNHHHYEHLHAS